MINIYCIVTSVSDSAVIKNQEKVRLSFFNPNIKIQVDRSFISANFVISNHREKSSLLHHKGYNYKCPVRYM